MLEHDFPQRSNPELKIEIQRFTDEARQELENRDYSIHELTGQSIKTLREAGRPFWTSWHEDYPDLEAMKSRYSEVAINSERLFYTNSNQLSFKKQERFIATFSKALSRKVRGIKVIIGEAPDYIELAFAHLDATGEYLFGQKYNFDCTRTKTKSPDGWHDMLVGDFGTDYGLGVHDYLHCPPDFAINAGVVPLVVPAGNK